MFKLIARSGRELIKHAEIKMSAQLLKSPIPQPTVSDFTLFLFNTIQFLVVIHYISH